MVNFNMNTTLADASHRLRNDLFKALKCLNFSSQLFFLKECKRRHLIPLGLRSANKLLSTYPSLKAKDIEEQQSRQWSSLTITELYMKLNKECKK